jgi:hypothetical protein
MFKEKRYFSITAPASKKCLLEITEIESSEERNITLTANYVIQPVRINNDIHWNFKSINLLLKRNEGRKI